MSTNIKVYRAAIVGRLDHDDVVLEADHIAEIAAQRDEKNRVITKLQAEIAKKDARIKGLEGAVSLLLHLLDTEDYYNDKAMNECRSVMLGKQEGRKG